MKIDKRIAVICVIAAGGSVADLIALNGCSENASSKSPSVKPIGASLEDVDGSDDGSDDSSSDAGDASDGGCTNGPQGVCFPAQLQAALVAKTTACCSAVGVDLSSSTHQTHLNNAYVAGWINQSNAGIAAYTLGSVLGTDTYVYNDSQAQDCLSRVSNMTCTNITEEEYNAITASCFAVYTGTIPVGSPCTGSVQCVASSFCDLTATPDAGVDGSVPPPSGTGVCKTLQGVGDYCGAYWATHEYSCSKRGMGSGCDTSTHNCLPLRSTGTYVSSTPLECAAGMLNSTFQCATVSATATYPFLTSTICGYF